MLVPIYLGALVLGGVLLGASLLVGAPGPLRVRSLAFAGLSIAFTGLGCVVARALGVLAEGTTIGVGLGAGLFVASVGVVVSRLTRRKPRGNSRAA